MALQRDQAQQYPQELGSETPTLHRMSEGYKAEQVAEEKANKKRKGLAKIWKIVTGQSRAAGARGPDRTRSVERAEDDMPLAPPPPLSYLVSRSSREPRQHATVPSLASVSSGAYPASPAGASASPATAPSSLLPSPTSSARRSGPEADHEGAVPSVLDERNAFAHSRTMLSEPDMRELPLRSSVFLPSGEQMRSSSPQRPASMKREKSLPPLPHELGSSRSFASTLAESRPATMFYGQTAAYLDPPQAPFRTADTRRQSFGGTSSRPDLGLHSLSHPQSAPYTNPQFAAPYGEFGMSRGSLGRLDDMSISYESNPASLAATAPKKRKSRFGLSSLFGKKGSGSGSISGPGAATPLAGYPAGMPTHTREYSMGGSGHAAATYAQAQAGYEYAPPSQEPSSSEGRHDYGSMAARGRAMSAQGMVPRMSVASRKAIEELVEQDREFVAYRYPSTHDQGYEFPR